MAKLQWDLDGQRLYETGFAECALFVQQPNGDYAKGVAWNGATGVNESPEGGDSSDIYANNGVYLQLDASEKFKGSITAYTYPDEWAACDGSAVLVSGNKKLEGIEITAQQRSRFGLAYKTLIGNDTEGTSHGYTLHLVYNGKAGVSSRDYKTVNDSPEAIEFSWDFSTTPVKVPGLKPTAHIRLRSDKVAPEVMKNIEDFVYGSTSTEPALPTISKLIELASGAAG